MATYNWYAVSSGTAIHGTSVSWSGAVSSTLSGTGTASGITASGGASNNVIAYNFTIPNIFMASGTSNWQTQLGGPAVGVVGYASYVPMSGVNYYFLVNLQSSGTTNVTMFTQFINPANGSVISGTVVSGSTVSLSAASGTAIITATGTNYNKSIPSNTIQLVLSGSNTVPYNVYEFGIYNSPTTLWSSPSNRTNMRIGGVARVFLPTTNNGTYRASLLATDSNNNVSEIAYKIYQPGTMPLNSWFDIELTSYTAYNYIMFTMQIQQTNLLVTEVFYTSMLAPFYHPVRYEYTNISGNNINGTTGWYPITTGINNPDYFISTVSGLPASGIQVRMTALDPYIFISGVSVVPYYKQNPYYAGLEINYLGTSKTNELSKRVYLDNKPYFQLNQDIYPSKFKINRIAGTVTSYQID